MDIERLTELKQQVFDSFQLYEVKMQNSFEESMKEVTPTGEMDEVGNDLTVLIDTEIARQSVTDEAVARVLNALTKAVEWDDKNAWPNCNFYQFKLPAVDLKLLITALQEYKPWVEGETTDHINCCPNCGWRWREQYEA